MATFVPVCSVCEGEVFKMLDLDDNPYWLHFNAEKCSGPYYPKLNPPLNQVMAFEHVIRVNESGNVQDVPLLNPYFHLEMYLGDNDTWHDDFSLPTGWELLRGFSGQYNYSGPVMHPSEFIGGGMETYILETPGFYVALVVESSCGYTEEFCTEESGCDCEPTGWAVAYKPFTDTESES